VGRASTEAHDNRVEIERMKEVIRLLECALRECQKYLARLESGAQLHRW